MRSSPASATTRSCREYLLAIVLAAALYYLSVAPGVLWQDSGMAQLRVLNHDYVGQLGLALAHPLFYLVAQVFQFLPFHDSAFKTNLVSATAAVFTVANMYLLLYLLLGQTPYRRFSAALGAVSLAVAHTFWQHAALAEVYTVSTAILTVELLVLIKFARGGWAGWWFLAWGLNGLECSNHVLALLTLATIIIWSTSLVRRGRIKLWWFAPAVGLWLIGNLPYEYLGFRAWQAGQSPVSILHSMLFGLYQREVLNVTLSWRLLLMATFTIGLNFPTPNFLLVPLGLVKGRKIIGRGLWGLMLVATLFHLLFAIRYPVRDQYTFFIVPVLFLAIWLSIGTNYLLSQRPKLVPLIAGCALVPPLVYAILPSLIGDRIFPESDRSPSRNESEYFLWPWKTGYTNAESFARDVFAMVSPESIILSDTTCQRPLEYYQHPHVAGLRPDVAVMSELFARIPEPRRPEMLEALLAEAEHSVFVVRPSPHYCPMWILNNFRLEQAGPIYRIVGRKPSSSTSPHTLR